MNTEQYFEELGFSVHFVNTKGEKIWGFNLEYPNVSLRHNRHKGVVIVVASAEKLFFSITSISLAEDHKDLLTYVKYAQKLANSSKLIPLEYEQSNNTSSSS